jgi:hypothetical protein
MGRPRKAFEPVVAVNVRLTETVIAELDRMAGEMQSATTARVYRTDALRHALGEYFAGRAESEG